jgi:hypothetical protein
MSGTEYIRTVSNDVSFVTLDKHHSGLYAQVVAKLDQLWRVGIRYDVLLQNDNSLNGKDQQMPSYLPRYSAMVEYSPTEFSRLRFQIDRDLTRSIQNSEGWNQQPYTQFMLQMNLTIGAHGAHAF